MPAAEPSGKGLLVDYGGVLTAPLGPAFRRFEAEAELPDGALLEVFRAAYEGHDGGLIGELERGEIELEDFERQLAAHFTERGASVVAGGLVARLFAGLQPGGAMWDVVAQARSAGVRTALLSNSFGLETYPRDLIDDHFDAVVISAEVGIRKPDPAIFRLAAEQLGVPVNDCAFVDDLDLNVQAAETLGMAGVLHRDVATTAAALARVLEVPLTVPT